MKTKHTKKLLSLVLALAMVIGMMVVIAVPSAAATGEAWSVSGGLSGSGTEADPYLIQSAGDFGYFYTNTSASDTAYYKLTADVIYNNVSISATAPSFGGTLDGDGHTIKNLRRSVDSGFSGLFDTVTGTLKNLTFDTITCSAPMNGSAALISKLDAGAVVSNVTLTNITAQNGVFAATLALYAYGGAVTVENCNAQGNVSVAQGNTGAIGGLIAVVTEGCNLTVNDSTVNVTMTVANSKTYGAGGLIGRLHADYGNSGKKGTLSVTNCTVSGTMTSSVEVTIASNGFGGLIGSTGKYLNSGATIQGCTNSLEINATGTSNNNVGGIVGYMCLVAGATVNISNCVNYANLSGTDYVGGLVGRLYDDGQYSNNTVSIYNCANYGDVTASGNYAGGAFGDISNAYANSEQIISGYLQTGTVTAANYAGGLFGSLNTRNGTKTKTKSVKLTAVQVYGTVKVTSADGQVATISATSDVTNDPPLKVTATDATFHLTVYQGETVVAAPVTGYGASANVTVELPAGTATDLTSGTALSILNKYATANGYMLWVQGDKAPELMSVKLTLTSASLSLGGEMTLNMKLDATKLPSVGTPSSISIINGTTAYAGTLDESTQTYIFPVTGIAASDLATEMNFKIVVTIGDTQYTTVIPKTYSVLTYAENLYQRSDISDSVKNVLESLVVYAYAAETNRNGSSTILDDFNAKTGANLSLTDALNAYDAEAYARTDVDGSNINSVATVAASLSSGVNLVFKVTDATVTQLKVTVNETTYTYNKSSDNTITVTDLHAGMLRSKLTLTFVDADGATVTTATYAIGNYLTTAAVSDANTAAQQELAKATALYMYAVRAYAMNG